MTLSYICYQRLNIGLHISIFVGLLNVGSLHLQFLDVHIGDLKHEHQLHWHRIRSCSATWLSEIDRRKIKTCIDDCPTVELTMTINSVINS